MRSIRFFSFVLMVFSLCACYPEGHTPAQLIPTTETTGVVNTARVTSSVTAIPNTQEAFTLAPTKSSIRATDTFEAVHETPPPVLHSLKITIIYDNNSYDQRLTTDWGFSALVEYRDQTLLFDTGGNGQILMKNMHILGIDPAEIDSVVLSHAHEDHTAGLTAVLDTGARPVVYLLASFPASFKAQVEQFTQVSEISTGQSIGEGLWTTGDLGEMIPEQALIIQTESGMVVITGCAHPGIVSIIRQVQNIFGEPIRLVMGGFHLGSKSEAEINTILNDFRYIQVEQVAPCHCTGEYAIRRFADEYGKDFIPVGVGSVIRLDAATSE